MEYKTIHNGQRITYEDLGEIDNNFVSRFTIDGIEVLSKTDAKLCRLNRGMITRLKNDQAILKEYGIDMIELEKSFFGKEPQQ